jgi:divalent metal cation (Fe/Co/Zn/Cd) transporter
VEQVRAAALAVPGVREVTSVTGRGHGSDILVEMSIQVDPAMTVARAAVLANETRQAVYAAVPRVGDVMVEFNTDHLARLWARFR